MKKILSTAALLIFLTGQSQAQEISNPGSLGAGLAWTDLTYGLSGKYNFTETHAGQVILGATSFGFGTSSFSGTGRYLYNFNENEGGFANYKPYLYGQVGFWTVKFETFGLLQNQDKRFTTVTFGVGGGIEWTFDNFIDGLAFNLEAGYVGGSFDDGIGTFSGFSFGTGVHYYFDL